MNQYILVRPDKVPVDVSGNPINPHAPANWMSEKDCRSTADLLGLKVGFVFTQDDPYFFIDIDHCITDGIYSPIAQQLMEVFEGCYVEISQSGEGLHIFGHADGADIWLKHSSKNKEYGIEFYTSERYVLLTGTSAIGSWDHDGSKQLTWLVDSYFPEHAVTASEEWRDTPVPEWSGPADDEVLIAKLLNARPKFGGRASVADLMNGNEQILAGNYPTLNYKDLYDRSSADQALANHLAFWTGKNHKRIWEIMGRSALLRNKWTKHKNYLKDTIIKAVNQCTSVYGADRMSVVPEPVVDEMAPALTTGVQFMSASQQVELFKDCCYVKRNHGVLMPNGEILKPDQFKAVFGGHTFAMDATNERTVRNPWEAFIDNQAVKFPKVDGTCFYPQKKPRELIREEGLVLINTYIPLDIRRVKGDTSRFIHHMKLLFPNEVDYEVIIAYMAAMVQHQGTKFQWCPVIQGVEGNGKTLINRCVEAAIGSRYCHYPNASDLAGGGLKFNGWIEGICAAFIEELFSHERFNLLDGIKPIITNDRVEIQYKGRDQYTGNNVCNFIMDSNHRDPIKITYDQRRFWMNYTAQQTAADIRRDGMGGLYFRNLYDWLKNHDGYAMVAEFLWTYQIPAMFNPADECQRAPESTSIHEAVKETLGSVEQHILEAIEMERQGFRGGYISSKCLDDLLREIRMDSKLSPHRRLKILEALGYKKHPWLADGRTPKIVAAEGSKIRLYYTGSLNSTQWSQAFTQEQYEANQGYPPSASLEIVK